MNSKSKFIGTLFWIMNLYKNRPQFFTYENYSPKSNVPKSK